MLSCSAPSGPTIVTTTGNGKIESISQVMLDLSLFDYIESDISESVSALGIGNESASSRALDVGDSSKYILLKTEGESNNPEAVEFEVSEDFQDSFGNVFSSGTRLSLEDLSGTVDKLYVMGDYTLISFISLDIRALLSAQQTTISGTSDHKVYEGKMEFKAEDVLHSLEYSYDDAEDYLSIAYIRDDGKEKKEYRERLTFRSGDKCKDVSDEGDYVKKYDTSGYGSSFFRKSFLIDNNTGLVYPVLGLDLSVQHGIAYDKDLGPVAIVKDSNELNFVQLVSNEEIYVYDVLCDKYGQYYVLNDSIDEAVQEDGITVVYYTKNSEYVQLEDRRMLHIDFGPSGQRSFNTDPVKNISIVGKDLTEESLDYVGGFLKGGTIREEKDVPSALREFNKSNGKSFVRIKFGSDMKFSSIDKEYLYGYFVEGATKAEFCKVDLSTNDCCFIEYKSRTGTEFYDAPDASTLLVLSRAASEKNKYSIYSVHPYGRDEYKQHYFNYVLKPNGKIEMDPTYEEFKEKYYKGYRKANTDRYTPDEFRQKYQIDLEGTGDIVDGWWNIEGVSYDVEGVYSETLKNAAFYYVWKEGYSDETFKDMYYRYIYVEDGVVKSDLTNHPVLENVSVSGIDWSSIDFMDFEFSVVSSKGTKRYRIYFDDETREYTAGLASSVDAERKKVILQPICR